MTRNYHRRALLPILCCAAAALTACSLSNKPDPGTYQAEGLLGSVSTVTFEKDDKYTLSAFGLDVSGTYEISDDNIIFNYTLLNQELSLKKSYQKDGDTIYIDGTAYKKS